MIAALLLLLQAQKAPPTVGDTIWLERTVVVPPGAEVRAAAWEPEGPISLLGKPEVRRSGGSATIAYPAVAWVAGSQSIDVPGPIIINHDGSTDSLPAESRTIEVASVLPAGQAPDKLPVQPEAGIVAERIRTPAAVVGAVLAGCLLLAPLVWWWRRRGPVVPPVPAVPAVLAEVAVPVGEWSEAGETRAVAAVAAHSLRAVLVARLPGVGPGLVTARLIRIVEEQRPQWPAADIAAVLRGLDAAQFAETASDGVAELASRAGALCRQLEGIA
jgi:hypothetical protein